MILEGSQEIADLVSKFRELISLKLSTEILGRIGHQGRSWEVRFRWSGGLNMWMVVDDKAGGDRYWTAFGLGEPIDGRSMSIVVEINFPVAGINRTVAGAFARTSAGKELVLHRGKIGGGRFGVGKERFTERFASLGGEWHLIRDGNRETKFALVGELESPYFVSQVRGFVTKVAQIKENTGLLVLSQ